MELLKLDSSTRQLDQLLELVCVELQITEAQYAEAERSYRAIGSWLDQPESPLAPWNPEVFPQGSNAIGTTVKPRRHEEFDVDLVCLLHCNWREIQPLALYNSVLKRIREHGTYRGIVVQKERCIRLDYAGQFHLDIVPACPAPRSGNLWGEFAIVIPDREQRSWVPTNPRGFAHWFATRLDYAQDNMIAASVEPLPPNTSSDGKSVLQRVVQLFKRRRDVHFNGDAASPRSILLTTICAMLYEAEASLTDGVMNTVDRLIELGRRHTGASVPNVPNPTDTSEDFARHWHEDRRHFDAFIEYITVFQNGLRRLQAARGLEKVGGILNELFDPAGSGAVDRAVNKYAEKFQQNRESDLLRIGTPAAPLLTTVAARPSKGRIAPTRFYGAHD